LSTEANLYLSVDEVLRIHERVLERFGGRPGVRDLGLLESVLFRPRSGHYSDIAEIASALVESLVMNCPFTDGNQRVAFFATDVFLRLNGWKLAVEPQAAHSVLVALLEQGQCDASHLLPWIRESLVRTAR
jgi:death-on-curing protein